MYEGGLFDQRPSVKYKHIILFIVVVVFVVCLSGELSMVNSSVASWHIVSRQTCVSVRVFVCACVAAASVREKYFPEACRLNRFLPATPTWVQRTCSNTLTHISQEIFFNHQKYFHKIFSFLYYPHSSLYQVQFHIWIMSKMKYFSTDIKKRIVWENHYYSFEKYPLIQCNAKLILFWNPWQATNGCNHENNFSSRDERVPPEPSSDFTTKMSGWVAVAGLWLTGKNRYSAHTLEQLLTSIWAVSWVCSNMICSWYCHESQCHGVVMINSQTTHGDDCSCSWVTVSGLNILTQGSAGLEKLCRVPFKGWCTLLERNSGETMIRELSRQVVLGQPGVHLSHILPSLSY